MHLEILSGVFLDPRPRRQSRTRGPPPNGRFATEGPSHFAMDLQKRASPHGVRLLKTQPSLLQLVRGDAEVGQSELFINDAIAVIVQ